MARMWKIAGSVNQANWHSVHRLRDLGTRRQLRGLPRTVDYVAVQGRIHSEMPASGSTSLPDNRESTGVSLNTCIGHP
jgi:hypothetical protein